jgi:hypothetical protein
LKSWNACNIFDVGKTIYVPMKPTNKFVHMYKGKNSGKIILYLFRPINKVYFKFGLSNMSPDMRYYADGDAVCVKNITLCVKCML